MSGYVDGLEPIFEQNYISAGSEKPAAAHALKKNAQALNVDTVRRLDRRLGAPLCLLLTLARRLFGRRTPGAGLPAPRRILVIKLSEMGSTVLAVPALEEIRRQCPAAELYFLVFSENRPILDALRLAPPERIVAIPNHSLGALARGTFAALVRLRRARLDATLDLDFFSRFTALFAFLACRGRRVGFHRFTQEGLQRGDLLTHRVLFSPHVHTSLAFVALARALFRPPDEEPFYRAGLGDAVLAAPRYAPPPAARQAVRALLAETGLLPAEGAPLVLLSPHSSRLLPLRCWPAERYVELARELLARRPDTRLALVGTQADAAEAADLARRVGDARCASLAGRVTFEEFLALCAAARLLIGNDGGPAHFAALSDLPAVVLFGPETPALYRPLSTRCRALYAGFPCSPCVSPFNAKATPCPRSLCLEALGVGEVLQAALPMLEPPPA